MNKRKGPMTAAELIAELNKDPEYRSRLERQEQERAEAFRRYQNLAEPVLHDLAAAGFTGIETIGDLRNLGSPYPEAIPILLKWLPRIADSHVREDLVRALSVPWAEPAAVPVLIAEFKKRVGDGDEALLWAIANALEVVADDTVFEEISELALDEKYGKAREMLVLALAKMRAPTATHVLIKLLEDEEVVGHAAAALGELKAEPARRHLEKLLRHPRHWVRAEAQKALRKIDEAKNT